MKFLKSAALAAVACAAVSLTSCGARHSEKEVYYLIGFNMALPYWQTAVAGFNHAAAEYGVTARVAGPDGHDAQAELAEFQKAVAAKPSGILISVADASVLGPEIDAAASAGIPVITIDSDAPSSHRLYFIGTNNLEAGRLGGRRVLEKLGGKGNVVFFTLGGQANTGERLKGFKDAFSTHPGVNIVEVVDIKGQPTTAFDRTQQFMTLTGARKIDAFVALDSSSGKMVADAVKRTGATDRLLIAWDASQDTLDAIKAGVIDSTIVQKPYTMGYYGLKALDEVFHYPPKDLTRDYSADSFSHYPVFVDTGTTLVDKSNVDLYIASAEGTK
ncbi:MAG TPA: substrate-binding domain-containing protein [Terracidiphilus sp.]|nr:substrate-binding domain-containing protein [Terracidiphilus sp.]